MIIAMDSPARRIHSYIIKGIIMYNTFPDLLTGIYGLPSVYFIKKRPPKRSLFRLVECKPVCKPSSVLDNHLSSSAVAGRIKRPTLRHAGPAYCPMFGLASGWSLHVPFPLPGRRWSLTPPFHPYRLKAGGLFLLHWS